MVGTHSAFDHLLAPWADRLRASTADASWRALVSPGTERTESLGEAVIVSTPVGHRRHFEVHVHDRLVAQRPTLAEAQAEAEKLLGPLSWSRQSVEPEWAIHYYFGLTDEFTEPTTAWIGKTAAKDLVLYHGTKAKHVPAIRQEGLRPPDGIMMSAKWYMLTTSKEQAARYVSGQSDAVVLEYHVPPDLVWASGSDSAVLWSGDPHTAYGFDATAYAIKGVLPSKYLVAVHS